MEPIISLPFSEYSAINQIVKYLKKSEGYSVFVPTSRQQKGIDFIIYNSLSHKTVSVQVKSSRTYTRGGVNYLWFNNFINKYNEGNADFYLLFGLYPKYNLQQNIRKGDFWSPIILIYSEKEMFDFMRQVVTKKSGNPDKFFAFGFDLPSKIHCSRGPDDYDVTRHLLKNQIESVKSLLS